MIRNLLATLSLAALCSVHAQSSNLVDGACVDSYDPERDYFPDKILVDFATHYQVEYHNNYKVVDVTAPGNEQKIVLYQCGTPQPDVPGAEKYISVPVTKAVVAVTTLLPWIEQLGERGTIIGWGTVSPYSPCTVELLNSGVISDSVADNGYATNYTIAEELEADVIFESFVPSDGLHPLAVGITEYLETSVLTTGEWIEFMSLFYNKEAEANVLFTMMRETFECNKRRAELFQGNNYTVAWVEWNSPNNAWDIGDCPNYFCEITEASGGHMINGQTAGVVGSVDGFFGPYFTDEEFLSVVQDVDVLILKSGSWESIYGVSASFNKTSVLDQIRAVQEQRVYDVTRLGLNAWFEERLSEPDVLLEDVMSVLNNDLLALEHTRVWLRHVFTEASVVETICEDPQASRVLRGDECEDPDNGNIRNGLCINEAEYNETIDYFPDKMIVDYSLHLEVEYYNSYKIVRNSAVDETIVLYQCGTPKPSISGVNKYISVPVAASVVAVTTIIPWLEQLGERGSIAALGTNPDAVYSPCVNVLLDNSEIQVATTGFSPNYTYIESELDVDVIFVAFPTDASDLSVAVTEWQENTVLRQGEWVEFLALFFNKEVIGTSLVETMVDTYECTQDRADALGLKPKPKVSWIEWKDPLGWEIGPCPNYFCEISEGAGGEYVEEAQEGSIPYVVFGTVLPNLHTDEELLASLADVDFLVFKGVSTSFTLGWDELYGDTAGPEHNKTVVLDQLKAVQNRNVYDPTKLSGNAWFEERVSEPDVLLEDMVAILNPDVSNVIHERIWLRNVFTEGESPETDCPDPDAQREQRGDPCTPPEKTDTDDDDGVDVVTISVVVAVVVMFGVIVAAVLIAKPWRMESNAKPEHFLIEGSATVEEAHADSTDSA